MKRVMCPKCENYITFDETQYNPGQSLVFICEHCKKQFGIRLGKSPLKSTDKNETEDLSNGLGHIIVIENVFGYKQILPLTEGDNIIGRKCIGNTITASIETGDMSMDRRHCIINVKKISKANLCIYSETFPV